MGQEMSEFAEGVPSMVGSSLMKMAHVVAEDLHEKSLYDPVVGSEGWEQEQNSEHMGSSSSSSSQYSPLYIGFWEDSEGRPFYYDTRQQAYFYLERQQQQQQQQQREEPEKEDAEGTSERKDENGDDGDSKSRAAESTSIAGAGGVETEEMPTARQHSAFFMDVTSKIAEDLRVIYGNVTRSISMLLVRGDTLEETRRKLDDIMGTASSLERRSRCLTCAHRCNSFLPGTGFNFIMRIADLIPMSACCRENGACSLYVLLSDDDDDGDGEGDDMMMNHFVGATLDPIEHHLE